MSEVLVAGPPGTAEAVAVEGSPWSLARRRLLRNRIAMAMLAVFLGIVVPVPGRAALRRSRRADQSVSLEPRRDDRGRRETRPDHAGSRPRAWGSASRRSGPPGTREHYLLGADGQGRDVAARLLYGGRNSLLIGAAAALLTCVIATLIGLAAGFFGGAVDGTLSRLLDIVWAFPVYLLAISLSTVLLTSGFSLGPIVVEAGSLWLPIVIIGIVYVPYVARPIRGEVLALRNREFIEAAIGLGASTWRLLWSDVLPNILTTVIVCFPIVMALAMLTEAALSFLSIGVQPPDASWGTIILDGQALLYTRPAVAIAPGIAIALTVLSLNVLGDGIRDALDPRAKVRRRGVV